MPNIFWLGFFYGACAAAIPLLLYMSWDANQRVQEWLNKSFEETQRKLNEK